MREHPSCLVVTGGELELAFARSFLERETFDLVIAVDGGRARSETGLGCRRL